MDTIQRIIEIPLYELLNSDGCLKGDNVIGIMVGVKVVVMIAMNVNINL